MTSQFDVEGEVMVGEIGLVVVGVVIGLGALLIVLVALRKSVKVVQQGSVGVVKRLGQFMSIRQAGVHVLVPFMDQMAKVDIREFPGNWRQAVGDHQGQRVAVGQRHPLLPGHRREGRPL